MADYYISPSGNDTTGDGSSGNPWLTTSKAIASSTGGDTIYFQDGTYTLTAANYPFDEVRTYRAVNVGQAILDGAAGDVQGIVVGNRDIATPFTIRGLVFQNIVSTTDTPILALDRKVDVTFEDCIFHNITCGSQTYIGGLISPQNSSFEITALTLTNCLIYDLSDNSSGSKDPYVVRIRQNTVNDIDLTLTRCTIVLNNAFGGVINYPNGGTAFVLNLTANKTIFYSAVSAILFDDGTSGDYTLDVDYNNTYGFTLGSYVNGANDVTSDPNFIDPTTTFNFNLGIPSPARGAGGPP